jgi:prepilin-type N-terminal cleavage/methylation domain-containing protein
MRVRLAGAGGFSLLEVLIAAAILLISLSALAQLLVAASAVARRARALTLAAVFAQDKLETLLPQAALDATLRASPADTLTGNVGGFCDFLDSTGRVIGEGTAAPPDAWFVRRWSIDPSSLDGATLALRVLVVDARRSGVEARLAGVARRVP